MNIEQAVYEIARKEFREEQFRAAVEKCKQRLREDAARRRWWHHFFPFRVRVFVERV